jgi:transposase
VARGPRRHSPAEARQGHHALLARDHGLEASYDTLWRFAHQELAWREKPSTVRIDDPPPGQEAQIDFGKMGLMLDPESGKKRTLWALIITLVFSRYQYVWPTFRQTTAAVCEGLDRAWMFFRGITPTLIPDNTKAMINDPDALAPTLVAAFLDYVQARGIFVDPARVRSPKDKPRVENQVPFVRESWFDGETFTSLEHACSSAEHWCREIAGTRVHGTTRKVPREVYESVEKPLMLPPPAALYDVPLYVEKAKVHPDHHIQVAQALYSVPNRYLRKHVRVRADRKLVKIYFGTELIKIHERQPPGGRATDPSDYPSGKSIYATRDVDALLGKAKERGVHIGIYAERLLGGPLPWSKMRQAYALIGLCDKYGDGRVEAICQSSLAFDVVSVPRIARMLKSAAKPARPNADGKVVQLPLPRFVRPTEHFETRTRAGTKEVL